MSTPSIILCGSQAVEVPDGYLAALRAKLLSDSRLEDLVHAIQGLPNLWHTLVEADPTLQRVDGEAWWRRLVTWLDTGALPLDDSQSKPNALVTPLLVLSQILEYIGYLETLNPARSHLEVLEAVQWGGIQGFCTGFLTAVVLSCAEDQSQITRLGAVAIRLAACVGLYIDINSICATSTSPSEYVSIAARWSTAADEQRVLRLLQKHPESYISVRFDSTAATITAPKASAPALAESLAEVRVQSKTIPLSGRFHHQAHQTSFEKLSSLCSATPSLRFPDSIRPLVPLRRNVDGERLDGTQPLHVTALSTLMLDVSNWYRTVTNAVEDIDKLMKASGPELLLLGIGDCVPRSIKQHRSLQIRTVRTIDMSSTAATDPNAYRYPEGSIAIVGMGCRYPGADSLEEYWKLIESGTSMLGDIPSSRFQTTGLRRDPEGKIPFKGNFLREADMFDHRFFKRSSREAAAMDPQHRLALEVAYETLESAGYFRQHPPAKNVGCYMGVAASDYEDNVASHTPTAFSVLGMVRAFTSGKISHFFGWSGPSMVFDTACSSSMVAIHTACRALQAGECSMALAGGVNVITSPSLHHNLGAANFLTPTGACKSFDDRADGYCRGEGAGIVLLKKLSSALADRDRILGVIVGSAINQNDNAYPITVPVTLSQTTLYRRVLDLACMPSRAVSYVEAHGTGTPKGDPIECASIRQVFGGQPDRRLFFGSVKGNIGHTEAASGVAGLIKVLLMMKAQKIPPQANFISLNRSIPPLESDNMAIARGLQQWKADFRAACVTNYGAAGSNAALIVTQPPSQVDSHRYSAVGVSRYPIVIAANMATSVNKYSLALLKFLERQTETQESQLLASTAFHLARRHNPSFRHVEVFAVSTVMELKGRLQQIAVATDGRGDNPAPVSKPVVLAFGGQTSNIVHLSEQVYSGSRLLAKSLDRCDTLLKEMGLNGLFPRIFERQPVEDTVDLHCMLFAVQYASASAWIASGLPVERVVGHSFGQLTAMCIAGVINLPDALRLISGRASIIKKAWGPEKGSMMLVQGEQCEVEELISQLNQASNGSPMSIACYNGPVSFVVVGSDSQVDAFEGISASRRSLKTKRISVTHGFHSSFVDSIMPEYYELAKTVSFHQPKIAIETCSKGSSWSKFTPELVAQQSREPVYFTEAVNRIVSRLGPCTWVEAGSASGITAMAHKSLHDLSLHDFHPVNLGNLEPPSSLADTAANLWKAGVNVNFWPFNKEQHYQYLNLHLPPYQFERSRHWLDYVDCPGERGPAVSNEPMKADSKPGLVSLVTNPADSSSTAEFSINQDCEKYQALVRGHAVLGNPLCPAALYVEIIASAASALVPGFSPPSHAACIDELHMSMPLAIDTKRSISLTLSPGPLSTGSPGRWKFTLRSYPSENRDNQTQHASRQVTINAFTTGTATSRFSRYRRIVDYNRCEALLSDPTAALIQGPIVYKLFDKVVIYADIFRGVQSIAFKNQETTGLVVMPDIGADLVMESVCNPLVVDSFTQVAGLHVNSLDECGPNDVFLCTAIEQIDSAKALASCSGSWLVHSSFERVGPRELINDIFIFDSVSKELVMTIFGVRFSKVPLSSLRKTLERANTSAHEPNGTSTPVRRSATGSKPSSLSQASSEAIIALPSLPDVRYTDTPRIKDAVNSLLHEVADVPLEDISEDSSLEALGIDSLMTTELISAVRERFSTDISPSVFQAVLNVKDLYICIQAATGSGILTPLSSSGSDASDSSLLENRYTTASTPHSEVSFALGDKESGGKGYAVQVARLAALIAEHLDTTDDISSETPVRDIGLDSLVGIELAADIQQIFGKKIDLAALDPGATFDALCQMVIPRSVVSRSASPDKVDKSVRWAATEVAYSKEPQSAISISAGNGRGNAENHLGHSAEEFARIRSDCTAFAKQIGFADFRSKVYPQQRELVCAYVTEAFAALGCDLSALAPGTVLPPIQYIPKHEKVMGQYYKVLADAGLIVVTNGSLLRTSTPVNAMEAEHLYQEICGAFPQHLCEHRLLHSTGSQLASCLRGETAPLQILFGAKAGKDLMEDVYTNSPMFATGTRILGEFFVQAFAKYKSTEKLRILELGAGTGGTTKYIVEKLLEHKIPFTYTFTDLSSSLLALAKRKFGHYGDCMEFAVLDVEKSPPDHLVGSYHAVFASNCVHATKNLLQSTINARKLLRSNGFICLLELTRNLFWLDCVFGLLEGWWLFGDGREHVLADERLWERTLLQAGFQHVDWTDDETEESDQFRVVVGFMADLKPDNAAREQSDRLTAVETVQFATVDGIPLLADIYYPSQGDSPNSPRPVALMIHGGGHIMLSRKDIRPSQTKLLLDRGFLPVSIDYRLCPEVTLTEGPIADVCTALGWAQTTLPKLHLQRPDIIPQGEKRTTTGHPPPDAILAFYCPTDYESDFYRQPNFPENTSSSHPDTYDILEGIQDHPITAYNVPAHKRAVGGWMSMSDARSRIALHMNWRGQALPVLLNGLPSKNSLIAQGKEYDPERWLALPQPSADLVRAVSPYAQIKAGNYRVPTFLIHGTRDDLIPWQHSQRTVDALVQEGVSSGLAVVEDAVHLFDLYRDPTGMFKKAVTRGYDFLVGHI
ncbi:hypothetical protein BDV12DRAFT_199374 [Aspergillus spectabilis]